MTYTSLARPTIVLLAAAAFAACASGAATSSTTAAPTPAGSSAPSATMSASNSSSGLPSGVTVAMVATGDSLFHARSCARCHGADAKGAKNGPDLTTTTHLHIDGSYDSFVRIITTGVPASEIKDKSHQFAMRARGGQQPVLTDDQVKDVAAYIYSLSHK